KAALLLISMMVRAAFNSGHITGAVSIPAAVLVESVSASLELERDIYVYGDSDKQSSEAANQLRDAGYKSVAELTGGLPAWAAIRGSVEVSGMKAA
ncbi:MAG: rhodanese-like domain-containing protein, partial [Cyanobacteria bacterium J06598_3]